MTLTETKPSDPCLCGNGKPLATCCGRFLNSSVRPETAQELMRSRYSAYVLQNIDYLHDTLWPKYQPGFDRFSVAKWAATSHWTGLQVLKTTKGGPKDRDGTVLFEASYLADGKLHTHRENSLFKKSKGRWYYVKALDET